jgi:hypothetical protein
VKRVGSPGRIAREENLTELISTSIPSEIVHLLQLHTGGLEKKNPSVHFSTLGMLKNEHLERSGAPDPELNACKNEHPKCRYASLAPSCNGSQ